MQGVGVRRRLSRMNFDLFDTPIPVGPARIVLGKQALVLCQFAQPYMADLLAALADITARAPMRHMVTPGGFRMSVALTNCGALGWTTDRRGYRYCPVDPESGEAWPAMPEVFYTLARAAALAAGFTDFSPDACLINRYVPGAKMSLHQDKNECDYDAPIVSVSLGMTATFLFGGLARGEKTSRTRLHHGDVVVWGGEDRLRFHGIAPLAGSPHAVLGAQRINFTLRRAGPADY